MILQNFHYVVEVLHQPVKYKAMADEDGDANGMTAGKALHFRLISLEKDGNQAQMKAENLANINPGREFTTIPVVAKKLIKADNSVQS